MKKVYLVNVSLIRKSGLRSSFVLDVFSSARLAQVYCDYKQLQVFQKGAHAVFDNTDISDVVEYAGIYVSSQPVSHMDWSDELKDLQDEIL